MSGEGLLSFTARNEVSPDLIHGNAKAVLYNPQTLPLVNALKARKAEIGHQRFLVSHTRPVRRSTLPV